MISQITQHASALGTCFHQLPRAHACDAWLNVRCVFQFRHSQKSLQYSVKASLFDTNNICIYRYTDNTQVHWPTRSQFHKIGDTIIMRAAHSCARWSINWNGQSINNWQRHDNLKMSAHSNSIANLSLIAIAVSAALHTPSTHRYVHDCMYVTHFHRVAQ